MMRHECEREIWPPQWAANVAAWVHRHGGSATREHVLFRFGKKFDLRANPQKNLWQR